MKCDEFENQLQEVLDQRGTPSRDPFLGKHANCCAPCQRKLHLYEALFDGLELAEAPCLGAEFSNQITRTASIRRRSFWKPAVAVSIAVAASLLAMFAVGNRGTGEAEPGEPVVNQPLPGEKEAAPRVVHREPRQSSGGTLAPKVSLTGRRSRTAAEEPASLAELDEAISKEPYEILTSFAKQKVDTVKVPGLRPFATSLTTAFSAIRQTLPGGRDEETAPTKPQAGNQVDLDSLQA